MTSRAFARPSSLNIGSRSQRPAAMRLAIAARPIATPASGMPWTAPVQTGDQSAASPWMRMFRNARRWVG